MEAENQGTGSSINEQEQQQQQQRQQQANEDAARLQEARDQFRRSLSSLNKNKASPTRTLRLTAQEQQQSSLSRGDGTPIRYTREELFRRPRSNPRSRTPMRYESPLEDNAFTRQPPQQPQQQPQRITIRPGAGSAVGASSVFGNSIHERPVTPKSGKQGPSHRKIRRWNNDKFTRLASEIASSNKKAADVLLKAHSEAHLFRDIYDPKDHQPSKEIKE